MGSVKLVMCDVMIIDEGDGDSEAMLFSSLVALYWATAHCSTLVYDLLCCGAENIWDQISLGMGGEREGVKYHWSIYLFSFFFFIYEWCWL